MNVQRKLRRSILVFVLSFLTLYNINVAAILGCNEFSIITECNIQFYFTYYLSFKVRIFELDYIRDLVTILNAIATDKDICVVLKILSYERI